MASSVDFIDFGVGITEVAKHISSLTEADITQEIEALTSQGKYDQIVSKFIENINVLIEKGKDRDVETCAVITTSIILNKLEGSSELIKQLCSVIKSASDKSHLRLRILSNTLNSINSNLPVHFEVLLVLMGFIRDHNLVDAAVRYAASFDSLISTWKISTQQQRQVLRILAVVLKKTKAKEFQVANLKFLQTISKEDMNEEVAELVANAVIDIIRSPSSFNFDDFFDLAPITSLREYSQYAKLVELLEILSKASLTDYLKFYESDSATLSSFDLKHDDVIMKVRLLVLCRLFAEGNDFHSYSTIAKAIQVNEDEIERYVIRLVGLKLAMVRIDQSSRTVFVSSSKPCVFGREQWEQVAARLATWKTGVSTVLQSIKSAQHQQQQQIASTSGAQ